jgi:hypothetical protein
LIIGAAQTPVSKVEVDDDSIVYWRYDAGAVVDLEAATEEVRLIQELTNEVLTDGCYLLIDIRPITSIDRASRRLFASEEVSQNKGVPVQALALVIGSPVGRVVGNFWFKLNSPPHPTRLFATEEDAQAWLLDQQA